MKLRNLLIVFMALAVGALACGGPVAVGGPTPTYEPIAVSSEAAQSLIDKFDAVGATSGEVTVSISESELTSYVEAQLQAQPDATITNPQIYLRDGKLRFYGTVTTEQLTANAEVVMNATIQDNKLAITVDSANFGPLPVPQGVLDSVTATLNNNLLELAGGMPTGVGLKSVSIADGVLTLTAVVK